MTRRTRVTPSSTSRAPPQPLPSATPPGADASRSAASARRPRRRYRTRKNASSPGHGSQYPNNDALCVPSRTSSALSKTMNRVAVVTSNHGVGLGFGADAASIPGAGSPSAAAAAFSVSSSRASAPHPGTNGSSKLLGGPRSGKCPYAAHSITSPPFSRSLAVRASAWSNNSAAVFAASALLSLTLSAYFALSALCFASTFRVAIGSTT
eukprot:31310-Pelagococcus_subviridis.AAC.14